MAHEDEGTGPAGPRGPQGVQGPVGKTGAQGPTGSNASQPLITPAIDIALQVWASKKMDAEVFNSFMFNQDYMGIRVLFKPFRFKESK